ncbi:hypothetical protein HPB49_022424 [Dermacentor silvarum]|uniref:Uncharacterized protein n=1 Tax=Dermacentor silvarum TaxID=543639 RepID=A0ACB8E3K7_DERSI|nr:hypothetical protein HPB49_022424 [Dermacentor silvarum]
MLSVWTSFSQHCFAGTHASRTPRVTASRSSGAINAAPCGALFYAPLQNSVVQCGRETCPLPRGCYFLQESKGNKCCDVCKGNALPAHANILALGRLTAASTKAESMPARRNGLIPKIRVADSSASLKRAEIRGPLQSAASPKSRTWEQKKKKKCAAEISGRGKAAGERDAVQAATTATPVGRRLSLFGGRRGEVPGRPESGDPSFRGGGASPSVVATAETRKSISAAADV